LNDRRRKKGKRLRSIKWCPPKAAGHNTPTDNTPQTYAEKAAKFNGLFEVKNSSIPKKRGPKKKKGRGLQISRKEKGGEIVKSRRENP